MPIDPFSRVVGFLARPIFSLIATAVITGCATVKPEPFTKYRTAVQEAQTGIDSVMSVNYNWTRSGFIEEFSTNPESKFSKIVIQPGARFDWKLADRPVYLDVKQTRDALDQVNEAFAKYADLLVQLSGGDLVSTAKFDQLTKDLNKNATDALKSLKITPSSQGVALFSTAACEAARLYIENKRQGYLRDAIKKNQGNVQDYCDLCISLLHTIRGNIKAYYGDRITPLENAWQSVSPKAPSAGQPALTPEQVAKRQKATQDLLALNEQFTDAMSVLQELEKTYKALPKAHADLTKAIENPKADLEGIQQLYSSAKRLQSLYTQVQKSQ